VVGAVRDHHVVPGSRRDGRREQQEPQRFGEPGPVAVGEAALAGADAAPLGDEVGFQLDELVVRGVGDEERPAGEPDHLPGEAQGRGRLGRRDVRAVAAVERAGGLVFRDQLLDQHRELVRVALARHVRDDVAGGVHDRERRPRPRGVGVPGGQLGVVEHRVVHRVALDRGRDGVRVGLVHELRRVHPDRHEDVGVALLQLAQLVDDVQAVHAREGPEVEQHDLAAQRGEGQRDPARVEPAPPGEPRRPYA
jgi:hypothetical protein